VIDRGKRPKKEKPDDRGTSSGSDNGEGRDWKRSEITGFSERSRRRLRKLLHSLDREADSLFLSLTWHEVLPTPDEAKAALDRFWKRMRRVFPGASAVWKMEPQERGYPHFHLMVYGIRWINPQTVSRLWHACTEETSEQHRKSGVDVEWVRGDEKLQSYLAKYFSKTDEGWPEAAGKEWEQPGRFWGKLERKNLPYAAWADWTVQLDPHQAAHLIRRTLDEWGVELDVLPPSLTINTRGDPSAVLDELVQ
jgi:hypothetical protein